MRSESWGQRSTFDIFLTCNRSRADVKYGGIVTKDNDGLLSHTEPQRHGED